MENTATGPEKQTRGSTRHDAYRLDAFSLRPMAKLVFSPRFVRFALVGASGVLVNLFALFVLADILNLHVWFSSASAIMISIATNFLLNDFWTFRDRKDQAGAAFLMRLYRYNVVSLVGGAVQWLVFVCVSLLILRVLNSGELGAWKYFAQLTGIGVATLWNFLSNFHWTWAQRETS